MRSLSPTGRYRRDVRRLQRSGAYPGKLLETIIDLLRRDEALAPRHRDHPLVGWPGCRECHVRPDLLLIYRRADPDHALILIRLGSHAELFG